MFTKQILSDPRVFQIAALGGLITVGIGFLGFSLHAEIAGTIIIAALIAQFISCGGRFDPLSALITALSLCLLLRTHNPLLGIAAALTAILSKQFIRVDGKHLFNPSALALVVVTTSFDGAWVSPGQWGHAAYLLILIAAAGSFVSTRAARVDTSLAFLGVFTAAALARAFYLGDPLDIVIHQLSNGALLIFAFFMISDPRTTPATRCGRLVFAALVALGAATIEFFLYRPNGAIFALVFAAPLVPLLDRVWPGRAYHWPGNAQTTSSPTPVPGVNHGHL